MPGARRPRETSVLVAGGGPTGLAAAVELGRRGIDCIVVEPRRAVSHTRPRAKTTSIRTMEHFRRWGISGRVREAAYLPVEWSQDVVFCDTLLGYEITRFRNCFGLSTERMDEAAESGQQIPQPVVEEVLRETVAGLGTAALLLGTRLVDLDERDDEVRVELADETGATRTIAASYVVGCDGGGSRTRAAIGASYLGESHPRPNLTVVFRAPQLAGLVPHGPAVQYWTLTPGAPSYMGRLDLDATWWIGLIGVDAEATDVDPAPLIDVAVGRPIAAEVVSTDPWVSRMHQASRYRRGRVLLAGDAAHLNPPWGGHGFNTGIADAVNVGWKLAAVLDGWGGDGLLDSYEEERRPIAERTIVEAKSHTTALSADLADPRLSDEGPDGDTARAEAARAIQATKHREFHGLGLVLGYGYPTSRIVVDDGTAAPADDVAVYRPTAKPGFRLPHAWLGDRSLYDELGAGFTVLRIGDDDPSPFERAARDRRVPLTVVDLRGRGLDDRYGAPLLLVRPDQHIAWRGAVPGDPDTVIDTVRGGRPR